MSMSLVMARLRAARMVGWQLGVALACASPVVAQQLSACNAPGAAFGITSYQCASCAIKQGKNGRTQYVFQAEPIVLETLATSALHAGDVVEAVNGDPIMTQAGADAFAYPGVGRSTVTVRRGNRREQLAVATSGCATPTTNHPTGPLFLIDGVPVEDISQVAPKAIESIEVLKGERAMDLYGPRAEKGVVTITTKRGEPAKPPANNEPVYVIDGVVQPSPSTIVKQAEDKPWWGIGRFGFALGCAPSCTAAKAKDGGGFYRFDAYPPVVAVIPQGPAERAGVRAGDLVSAIDGKSILTDEGALKFFRANKADTMHLTVLRNGQAVGYVLKAR